MIVVLGLGSFGYLKGFKGGFLGFFESWWRLRVIVVGMDIDVFGLWGEMAVG